MNISYDGAPTFSVKCCELTSKQDAINFNTKMHLPIIARLRLLAMMSDKSLKCSSKWHLQWQVSQCEHWSAEPTIFFNWFIQARLYNASKIILYYIQSRIEPCPAVSTGSLTIPLKSFECKKKKHPRVRFNFLLEIRQCIHCTLAPSMETVNEKPQANISVKDPCKMYLSIACVNQRMHSHHGLSPDLQISHLWVSIITRLCAFPGLD